MKTLPFVVCALSLPLLVAAGGAMRPAGPTIQGNYLFDYRELPDGKRVESPEIVGMMSYTKSHRNFNIYWMEGGKPTSISTISRYTLSDKEYTEEGVYFAMNDGGKGITYDTTATTGHAPVTVKGDRISFKLPLHEEPEVVFEKNGFTATRKGAFVDHWKRAD